MEELKRKRDQQVGKRPIRNWPGPARLCGDVLCFSWLLESVPKPWKTEDRRQKMVQREDIEDICVSVWYSIKTTEENE